MKNYTNICEVSWFYSIERDAKELCFKQILHVWQKTTNFLASIVRTLATATEKSSIFIFYINIHTSWDKLFLGAPIHSKENDTSLRPALPKTGAPIGPIGRHSKFPENKM